MVRTDLLRGEMAKNYYSITKLARELGISRRTLSSRINEYPDKFTQCEIETIIKILKIKNPMPIFFAENVS